jgi:hypothetical protein
MVLVVHTVPRKVAVVANDTADVDDAEKPFV